MHLEAQCRALFIEIHLQDKVHHDHKNIKHGLDLITNIHESKID